MELPREPVTIPQARRYGRRFTGDQGKVFREQQQITINIPRIDKTYLTKNVKLHFDFDLSYYEASQAKWTAVHDDLMSVRNIYPFNNSDITTHANNFFGRAANNFTVLPDRYLNAYTKPVPTFDINGAYGLINRIQVYDYLGNTLLEDIQSHDVLTAQFADFWFKDENMDIARPRIVDGNNSINEMPYVRKNPAALLFPSYQNPYVTPISLSSYNTFTTIYYAESTQNIVFPYAVTDANNTLVTTGVSVPNGTIASNAGYANIAQLAYAVGIALGEDKFHVHASDNRLKIQSFGNFAVAAGDGWAGLNINVGASLAGVSNYNIIPKPVTVPTLHCELDLISFLGRLSDKFVPLHNGFQLVITLNDFKKAIKFNTPFGDNKVFYRRYGKQYTALYSTAPPTGTIVITAANNKLVVSSDFNPPGTVQTYFIPVGSYTSTVDLEQVINNIIPPTLQYDINANSFSSDRPFVLKSSSTILPQLGFTATDHVGVAATDFFGWQQLDSSINEATVSNVYVDAELLEVSKELDSTIDKLVYSKSWKYQKDFYVYDAFATGLSVYDGQRNPFQKQVIPNLKSVTRVFVGQRPVNTYPKQTYQVTSNVGLPAFPLIVSDSTKTLQIPFQFSSQTQFLPAQFFSIATGTYTSMSELFNATNDVLPDYINIGWNSNQTAVVITSDRPFKLNVASNALVNFGFSKGDHIAVQITEGDPGKQELGYRIRNYLSGGKLLYNKAEVSSIQSSYEAYAKLVDIMGTNMDDYLDKSDWEVDEPLPVGTDGNQFIVIPKSFRDTIVQESNDEYLSTSGWFPGFTGSATFYQNAISNASIFNAPSTKYQGRYLLAFDARIPGATSNSIAGIDTSKAMLEYELLSDEDTCIKSNIDVFVEHDAIVEVHPGQSTLVTF